MEPTWKYNLRTALKALGILLWATLAAFVLVLLFRITVALTAIAANSGDVQTAFVADAQTGCQYIVSSQGGISPRFAANGAQVCAKVAQSAM